MADRDRRRLLRATDELLRCLEELRLQDVVRMPERLHGELEGVAAEISHQRMRRGPITVADAHNQVFRLQASLLGGGRGPLPRPIPAAGEPDPPLRQLVIPPRRSYDTDAAWLDSVRLVVQRAHDRVHYLDAQAEAAQALPADEGGVLAAVRHTQAASARRTFDRLSWQAQRITGRSMPLDPVPTVPTSGRLDFQDLVIDLDIQEVHRAGRLVPLTPQERAILVVLVANRDRAVSREALQHAVMGTGPLSPDVGSQVIRVHMVSLRTKLGRPPYLETIDWVGYRAATKPAPATPPGSPDDDWRPSRRAERLARAPQAAASPPATPPAARRRAIRP